MTRRVLGRQALERDLGAATDLARRLEKLGLLAPVAKNVGRGGDLYYDASVRPLVERGAALVAAGYASKDIALILGRVETRATVKLETVVATSDLAERTRLDAARIEGWVARGLVRAWAEDERGRTLFPLEVLPRVRALAALETLGLTDLMADFVAGSIDVTRVRSRLAEVEAAAKTLAKALPKIAPRKAGRVRATTRTAGTKKP